MHDLVAQSDTGPQRASASGSNPRRASKSPRIPQHVGLIPDGNRRWARERGLPPAEGYEAGIAPGLRMLSACAEKGIREVSIYGFTKENVQRPAVQVEGFRRACIRFAELAIAQGAALLVVGDADSPVFPREFAPYVHERSPGMLRVNMLANYGWQWDLRAARGASAKNDATKRAALLRSEAIPRVDLVVRWGGRRRLSGFLPLQCAYADLCVLDKLWPDSDPHDIVEVLAWYQQQDVTLGG